MIVFNLDQIERAFEARMRAAVVAGGYWPDVAQFLPGNDLAGFEAAKLAITAAGRPLIQVFGVGAYRDRGQLMANNVIISRLGSDFSDNAPGVAPFFEQYQTGGGADLFRKLQHVSAPEDIEFEVRFVCDDLQTERIIEKLMRAAWPRRLYLKGVNADGSETEGGFWVLPEGAAVDLSAPAFIERLWRFSAKDILLTAPVLLQEGIAPAGEITLTTGPGHLNPATGTAEMNESEATGAVYLPE